MAKKTKTDLEEILLVPYLGVATPHSEQSQVQEMARVILSAQESGTQTLLEAAATGTVWRLGSHHRNPLPPMASCSLGQGTRSLRELLGLVAAPHSPYQLV